MSETSNISSRKQQKQKKKNPIFKSPGILFLWEKVFASDRDHISSFQITGRYVRSLNHLWPSGPTLRDEICKSLSVVFKMGNHSLWGQSKHEHRVQVQKGRGENRGCTAHCCTSMVCPPHCRPSASPHWSCCKETCNCSQQTLTVVHTMNYFTCRAACFN